MKGSSMKAMEANAQHSIAPGTTLRSEMLTDSLLLSSFARSSLCSSFHGSSRGAIRCSLHLSRLASNLVNGGALCCRYLSAALRATILSQHPFRQRSSQRQHLRCSLFLSSFASNLSLYLSL